MNITFPGCAEASDKTGVVGSQSGKLLRETLNRGDDDHDDGRGGDADDGGSGDDGEFFGLKVRFKPRSLKKQLSFRT